MQIGALLGSSHVASMPTIPIKSQVENQYDGIALHQKKHKNIRNLLSSYESQDHIDTFRNKRSTYIKD